MNATAPTIRFEVPAEKADELSRQATDAGVENHVERDEGILPILVVALVLVVPPAIALLAKVTSDILEHWRDHGVIIDARGDDVKVMKNDDLPHGTIVILSKDGQTATIDRVPDTDLAAYVAAAAKGAMDGLTAKDAAKAGDDAAKAAAANNPPQQK